MVFTYPIATTRLPISPLLEDLFKSLVNIILVCHITANRFDFDLTPTNVSS